MHSAAAKTATQHDAPCHIPNAVHNQHGASLNRASAQYTYAMQLAAPPSRATSHARRYPPRAYHAANERAPWGHHDATCEARPVQRAVSGRRRCFDAHDAIQRVPATTGGSSWLAEWWDNWAYLDYRDSLPFYVSYGPNRM